MSRLNDKTLQVENSKYKLFFVSRLNQTILIMNEIKQKSIKKRACNKKLDKELK